MRTVAVVLAIPLALVGWQWWSDRSATRLLSPVASEVAGRDVRVECQSLWANLLDPLPRHGEVLFDANGVPEGRIFLTHPTCDRLQAFAGKRRHSELDCLRHVDWERPLPILPRSECYERSSKTVYALMILAHEAYHTAGETNEATTNCNAIQAMAYVGVRLGADQREAELAALAMAALEPLQGGGYGTDRCHAGSELDLHPETPAFPTEHPITAPHGLRNPPPR
jgi:hypothetical protein